MPASPEQLLALARRFANRALLAGKRGENHRLAQRPEAAEAWFKVRNRSRKTVRRLLSRIEQQWLPPSNLGAIR